MYQIIDDNDFHQQKSYLFAFLLISEKTPFSRVVLVDLDSNVNRISLDYINCLLSY